MKVTIKILMIVIVLLGLLSVTISSEELEIKSSKIIIDSEVYKNKSLSILFNQRRTRLPKDIANDPKLTKETKPLCIARYGKKDDMDVRICSSRWFDQTNKLGEITHRARRACVIYKEDGKCMLQYFELRENYKNGKLEKAFISPGQSEDLEEYNCKLNKKK